MDPILTQLRADWDTKDAALNAILTKDAPTKAELDQADALLKERDEIGAKIEAHLAETKRKAELAGKAQAGRDKAAETKRSLPFPGGSGNGGNPRGNGRIDAGPSEFEKFVGLGPFKSAGHFFFDVRRGRHSSSENLRKWHEGLMRGEAAVKALYGEDAFAFKAASGMNEFSDAEGGVLVPFDVVDGIWSRALEDDFNALNLPGLRVIPLTGNSTKIRARNDKSRATGSRYGGVQSYDVGEGGQGTNTKPGYRWIDLKLEKQMVLIPVTEELLEDSTAAEAEINDVAASEIRFHTNDIFFRGTGVGQGSGFLNAPAKVTVTSNNGANNTISATDIDNMWVRRAKPSGMGYVWLGNQDIEPQLSQLSYVQSSTNTGLSAQFLYVPAGGITEAPTPRLKGKPLYYTEFNESLGTEGDLCLIDPSQIAVAVKSTGIRQSISAHLRFDCDELIYKFVFRMDCRCLWDASLTRYKGSNALSPIITLETNRAS